MALMIWCQIIRKAVSGMLPKNKLRDRRLERLLIFPDEKHPYEQKCVKAFHLHRAQNSFVSVPHSQQHHQAIQHR